MIPSSCSSEYTAVEKDAASSENKQWHQLERMDLFFYSLLDFVSYPLHYQNNPLIIFLLKEVLYDQLSSWCNNVFRILLADTCVLYSRGISATHKHCSTQF